MSEIELKISMKIGAIAIEFEAPPDSFLVGVSPSDFAVMVLKLNDFVKPFPLHHVGPDEYDAAGVRVIQPELWSDPSETAGDPPDEGRVKLNFNTPPPQQDEDPDHFASTVAGEVVAGQKSLRSDDPILSKFLDEENPS